MYVVYYIDHIYHLLNEFKKWGFVHRRMLTNALGVLVKVLKLVSLY